MRVPFIALACAAFLASACAGIAAAATNPLGLTTLEQRIVPAGGTGFRQLETGPGEGFTVRDGGFGGAQAGREARRVELAYFGQLSDFQLADEESPARVEFVDPIGPPVEAAFRPWEALQAFVDDSMIRQIDSFAPEGAAPVAAGDGSRAAMDFAIDTGDSADSQQLNETEWVRALLDGGALDPNSGVDPAGYTHPLCPPAGVPGAAEAAKYTGVQDYDDYAEGAPPYFYDPDDPRGASTGWPSYPGLMDRAQQEFSAAGLTVPSYVVFGNHDALVQGNQAASGSFEQIGTGCLKPMEGALTGLAGKLPDITPEDLLDLLAAEPTAFSLVPPDPDRRYVSKAQYKQVFLDGAQADGHGFGDIDPAENAASGGTAGYYSFAPVPGLRMIAVDSVCEGGVTGACADGNIDDPQFKWIEAELKEATAADELVILFSHHAIGSLTANVPDEAAPACTAPDSHGHDVNPGCDADPRASTPIHLGPDMVDLLHRYPHAIAWIAGHSHVNDVTPYPGPDGHGFWSVKVAAEADWPQQSRLLQLFDNRDGTLSLFGTILDHASETTAPPPGPAGSLSPADLASIGRTLSLNDHQTGALACKPEPCGEGAAEDRNVELLIADPRRSAAPGGDDKGKGDGKGKGDDIGKGRRKGREDSRCSNIVAGGVKGETLLGTSGSDLLLGKGGGDRIKPRGGGDCVFGGRGPDRVYARGGGADAIRCGRGRDVAFVSGKDSVKGCERVRRGRRHKRR
jgi:3',5'-cyclic AMP phosphodiesterase CpdA